MMQVFLIYLFFSFFLFAITTFQKILKSDYFAESDWPATRKISGFLRNIFYKRSVRSFYQRSVKKVFLKVLQKLQGHTCVGVSF